MLKKVLLGFIGLCMTMMLCANLNKHSSLQQIPIGACGVVDNNGKWIIPAKQWAIQYLKDADRFWVWSYGDSDYNLEEVAAKCRLDFIPNDRTASYDRNGKRLGFALPLFCRYKPDYQSASTPIEWNAQVTSGLMGISSMLGEGFCDADGKLVCRPEYCFARRLSNNRYLVAQVSAKKNWYDLVPFADRFWGGWSGGGPTFNDFGDFDLVDENCRNITSFRVHWPSTFGEKVNERKQLVIYRRNQDSSTEVLMNIEDGSIGDKRGIGAAQLPEDEASREKLDDVNVDKIAHAALPGRYFYPAEFKNRVAFVSLDGTTFGAINDSHKTILPFEYKCLSWLSEDRVLAIPQKSAHFKLLNKKLELILEFPKDIDIVVPSGEAGLFLIHSKSQTWGLCNNDGRQIIAPCFNVVGPFQEGVAMAGLKKNGHLAYGAIEKTGKWVLAPAYGKVIVCSANRFIASEL